MRKFIGLAVVLTFASAVLAQAPAQQKSEGDMITRIFSGELCGRWGTPPPRWFDEGQSYITMEPTSGGGKGRDVVKYDTATGKNREVLITAAQLTPPGAGEQR